MSKQKPVGYAEKYDIKRGEGYDFWVSGQKGKHTVPLYTAPPKRKWVRLTDKEIAKAVGSQIDEVYLADFRKVIAKLKEKNSEY
jgi:transcription initiation factor IIE alpha subunit